MIGVSECHISSLGSRAALDPLHHLDDMGSRSMATGKAVASSRTEMRRQIARDGWWN
jgi:hypothetical protein